MAEDIEQIGLNDLNNLSIGKQTNSLYWHGKKVVTESRFRLSGLQTTAGVLVTLSTISAPIILASANLDKIKDNMGWGEETTAVINTDCSQDKEGKVFCAIAGTPEETIQCLDAEITKLKSLIQDAEKNTVPVTPVE